MKDIEKAIIIIFVMLLLSMSCTSTKYNHTKQGHCGYNRHQQYSHRR